MKKEEPGAPEGDFLGELREFRGEMREFKRQTLTRLSTIETRMGHCQIEPSVCATARLVEAHLRNHDRGGSHRVSVAAACISGLSCAINLAGFIARRS